MAETLSYTSPGIGTWRWVDMVRDLEEQGGLEGVLINPLSVTSNGCYGEFQGDSFAVSWKKDSLLMISMIKYSESLVEAFSKVVEYQPFCQYTQEVAGQELTVVEWAKNDAATRFTELIEKKTPNLRRLNVDTQTP